MRWRSTLGLILAAGVMLPLAASAASFTTAGLTFSDELGGFRLISVSGTGTSADPIVIVEEITGSGSAVLVIRGTYNVSAMKPVVPTRPVINLSVTKMVINRSTKQWKSFDLELQEILWKPSPYGDGLSFDQMGSYNDPLKSDQFAAYQQIDEPYDRVRFYDGFVAPGESVRFKFRITDATPKREFFLLQEQNHLIVRRSSPRRQEIAEGIETDAQQTTWKSSRRRNGAPR